MPYTSTIQSQGSNDGGADSHELNLMLFSGEVLSQFQSKNKLIGLTRSKNLAPGRKSEQFIVTGDTTGSYHTPGDDVADSSGSYDANPPLQGQRVIAADREFVKPLVMDKLEQVIAHWDGRAEYAPIIGHALAKQADQNILRVIARAARNYEADPFTGAPQGTYTQLAGSTAANLVDGIIGAQRIMDEKDVPEEDRFCVLAPADFELLLQSGSTYEWLDTDVNPEGNGSIASGKVHRIAGFQLVKSNNIPSDNFTGTTNQLGATAKNDYRVDLSSSSTKALCFQRQVVGTVKSHDVMIEAEYQMRLRADLVIGSYSMGHGVLRPECAVELATAVKPAAPA